MNIKQKLVVTLMAVAIIPMVIVNYLFFDNARNTLKADRIAALESIADLKVSTIERIIGNVKKDAEIAQDYLNIKSNLPVLTRLVDDRNNPAYIQAWKNLDKSLFSLPFFNKGLTHSINSLVLTRGDISLALII